MSLPSLSTPRLGRLLVLLGGLALFLGVFGPGLPTLGTRFLGIEYVDHYGTQWFYWFTGRALWEGEGFGHTDLFFFPWGKDVFAHTGANVLDALVALPLLALLGPVAGYNAFVLLGLAAGAWAAVRLGRHFSDDPVAIGVGAVCFALSPYALFELQEGRPTQALLLLLVLFVERMWVSGLRRGLAAPVLAGLLLALLGYQYWFYALFTGLACLAHGLSRAARPPEGSGGALAVLARHALIAGVALALVAPVAVPLVSAASSSGDVPGLLDVSLWNLHQAPPITVEETRVGLLEWQPLRAAHGVQAQNPDGSEVFLKTGRWTPWILLLPALLWWVRPGRLPRAVVGAMALAMVIIACGPIFLVGEVALPNPVYIGLAKALPFFRRLWWPGRAYAVLTVLSVMVLVAGLAACRERFGPRAQLGLAAAVLLGWGLHLRSEELAPFPTWDATIPAGYRCLAHGPEGALIELPYSWTQAHLYYQTAHGRPVLGGMIENNPVFTPAESVTLRQDNRFVAGILQLARMDTEALEPWSPEERQAVHELGYRYVVLQRDAMTVEARVDSMVDNVQRTRLRRVEAAFSRLLGEPVYEDARVGIYAPWGDPSPCLDHPVAPDLRAMGRPDIDSSDRVFKDLERQRFQRLTTPSRPPAAAESPKASDSEVPTEEASP